MSVWTQAATGTWARDEKLSLYQLLVGIIGVLVAIIAILVSLLVPNIRAALSLEEKQQQFDETIKQTQALIEKQETAIRSLQTEVSELRADLERVKADKDAAEQRAIQAEERAAVWQVAEIENPTQCDIPYEVLNADGSWTSRTLKPNESWVYWRKNHDIKVRYSYCLNGELREKVYVLNASKIVGHEPTQSERSGVQVSYFKWNDRSELVMHHK